MARQKQKQRKNPPGLAQNPAGQAQLDQPAGQQQQQQQLTQHQQQGLMTAADLMPLGASTQQASTSSMAVAGGGGGAGKQDEKGKKRKRREKGDEGPQGEREGDVDSVVEEEGEDEDGDDSQEEQARRQAKHKIRKEQRKRRKEQEQQQPRQVEGEGDVDTAVEEEGEDEDGDDSQKDQARRQARRQSKELRRRREEQQQKKSKQRPGRNQRLLERQQKRLSPKRKGQVKLYAQAPRPTRVLKLLRLVVAPPETGEEEAAVVSESALQAVILDERTLDGYRGSYTEMVQAIKGAYRFFRDEHKPLDRCVVPSIVYGGRRVVMLELQGERVGMFIVKTQLIDGVLDVEAFHVRPEYQQLGVAQAALHLITTLALGTGAIRIKFFQAIDARERPDLVQAWQEWGVTVEKATGRHLWTLSIPRGGAHDMHATYTQGQIKRIEAVEQQQRGGGST